MKYLFQKRKEKKNPNSLLSLLFLRIQINVFVVKLYRALCSDEFADEIYKRTWLYI